MTRTPITVAAVIFAAAAAAATLHVPADQATIQAAVAAAVSGDTILVAPGTYEETIVLDGAKELVIQSSGGPEVTTLRCPEAVTDQAVVSIAAGLTSATVIEGFTITGANRLTGGPGGAIEVLDADPVIRGNVIHANHADAGGAGIYLYQSSALVEKNAIHGNTGTSGVAIRCDAAADGIGAPLIRNNFIYFNTATVSPDAGGAVAISNTGALRFLGNTVWHNTAATGAGFLVESGSAECLIANSIFWGNIGTNLAGVTAAMLSHCNLEGGAAAGLLDGTGSIEQDPLFVCTDTPDLHIQPDSPCVGAGIALDDLTDDFDGDPRRDPPAIGADEIPIVAPVANLMCTSAHLEVILNWALGSESYSAIAVYRDGASEPAATLDGSATTWTDTPVAPGDHLYDVVALEGAVPSVPASCAVTVDVPAPGNLSCALDAGAATLAWTNEYTYDTIRIVHNSGQETLLAGTAISHTTDVLEFGTHTFEVYGIYAGIASEPAGCMLTHSVPPPANLTCTPAAAAWEVALAWENATTYGSVTILRDDTPLATIIGSPAGYTDTVPALGVYTYAVYGSIGSHDSEPAVCAAEVSYIAPVTITQCAIDAARMAHLAWTIGAENYEGITVTINGEPAPGSPLPPTATQYDSGSLDPRVYTFAVTPFIGPYAAAAAQCSAAAALPPPSDLACVPAEDEWTVALSWVNGWTYTAVTILRNGAVIASLDGSPSQYTDTVASMGDYTYEVFGSLEGQDSPAAACMTAVTAVPRLTITACGFNANRTAAIAWENGTDAYDGIVLLIDGAPAPESPLAGSATTYTSAPLSPGLHTFSLTPFMGESQSSTQSCEAVAPLPAPEALACAPQADSWSVRLTWQNKWIYHSVTVVRDDTVVATLAGAPTAYTDTVPTVGPHTYAVYGTFADTDSELSEPCMVDITAVPDLVITGCTFGADRIARLDWTNGVSGYDAIELLIDGAPAPESPLPGDATSYASAPLDPGGHAFSLRPMAGPYTGSAQTCSAVAPLPPPEGFVCVPVDWDVTLAWTNAWSYSSLTITRDGTQIAALDGDATTYTDTLGAPGPYTYRIVAALAGQESLPAECLAEVTYVPPVAISACTIDSDRVAHIAWTNGSGLYEGIDLAINGEPAPESPLDGAATHYTSAALDPGDYTFTLTPFIGAYRAAPSECAGTAILPSPAGLTCAQAGDSWNVTLTWDNGWTYEHIVIARHGEIIATGPGDITSYTDTVPSPGAYTYEIHGTLGAQESARISCAADVSGVPPVAITGCEIDDARIAAVTWTNGAENYEGITLLIDGQPAPESPLPGTADSYTSAVLAPGAHTFTVSPFHGAMEAPAASCEAVAPLPPPESLTCAPVADALSVQLGWTNGWPYDAVVILRNGTLIDTIDGSQTAYTDAAVPVPGAYTYEVHGMLGEQSSAQASCVTEVAYVPPVTLTQCGFTEDRVAHLEWTNGHGAYSAIEILIDGAAAPQSPLPGTATSFLSDPLAPGSHTFTIIPMIDAYHAAPRDCTAVAPLPPPDDITCTPADDAWQVALRWTNAWNYGSVTILRDGTPVTVLPGTSTAFDDNVPTAGLYTYTFFASLGAQDSVTVDCIAEVAFVPPIASLHCEGDDDRLLHVTWVNTAAYDAIALTIDGVPVPESPLPGTAVSYHSAALDPGPHTCVVMPILGGYTAAPAACDTVTLLPAPADITLTPAADSWSVVVQWTAGWAYDAVTILRDGVPVGAVAGDVAAYTDTVARPGAYAYEVYGSLAGQDSESTAAVTEVTAVLPPEDLACEAIGALATITWTNPGPYDEISITRDGQPLTQIAGGETLLVDTLAAPGTYSYEIRGHFTGYGASEPVACTVTISIPQPVSSLTCDLDGRDVVLAWINGESAYDLIEVRRDGVLRDMLAGHAQTWTDTAPDAGEYAYEVRGLFGPIAPETNPVCTIDVPLAAPEGLLCSSDGMHVRLEWVHPAVYEQVRISRDGAVVATLPGDATNFDDTAPAAGQYAYEITGHAGAYTSAPAACVVTVTGVPFVRGDANADGLVNIADVVFLLNYLFREGTRPSCMEAANINGDARLDIGDAVFLLGYLFREFAPPPAPFPGCGMHPGPGDGLGCELFAPCAGS